MAQGKREMYRERKRGMGTLHPHLELRRRRSHQKIKKIKKGLKQRKIKGDKVEG